MSRVDEELISLYKTLTDKQKKCVRVVITGMKAAKKAPETLTEREKRCVGVFIQAMKTVRKKTAEPALKTVNSQMI